MHEKKPLIAIAPVFEQENHNPQILADYHRMLMATNALPFDLPVGLTRGDAKDLLGGCDGLLLIEGPEVNPALYHQTCLPECGPVLPARDKMDRMLLSIALALDMPVFGIDRGLHILNVHLGGTLFQDLDLQHPSAVKHWAADQDEEAWHTVTPMPDGPLAKLAGEDGWMVNSSHHQSIKKLAKCLQPMAVSEDGLIEAAYYPENTFVWAVQWHPDLLWEHDEQQLHLCQAFSDQAWLYKKYRSKAKHDP